MSVLTQSPQALVEALGAVGGGRARLATAADVVAGLQPAVVVQPPHEDAVAAALAFADREGLAVLPRGGGTQLDCGCPPARGDIVLDLTALDAVVEHTPGDMTATVQAGRSLAALQMELGQAGQWLALDPALPPAATVGGIIATNASGPRRLRYGGVRDQIIGVRIVRPDGTIAKGGGKVVKNVAGFDLPKLFTGSLGALGVIVSATFRLYPHATASRTVTLTARDPAALCDTALRVTASTLVPSAIDVVGNAGAESAVLAVRFEGGEQAVEDQARALAGLAGGLRDTVQVLRDEAEASVWREAAAELSPAGSARNDAATRLTVKASLLLTEVAPWVARLRQLADGSGLTTSWRAHAGHGLVFARLAGAEDALAGVVEELRAAAAVRRGSLVVTDAPPALLRQIDPWGPVPAIEVMRRVKAQFDPRATLNPGRFVGGI